MKNAKNPRLTRIEIQAQRDAHIPISIDVPQDGKKTVQVLRPVHPKDALYVEYVAGSLGVVLNYLRVNGFTDQQRNLKHDGKMGIQKRCAGYIVVTKSEDGKNHFKSVKSMKEALQAQTDVDAV